MVNKDLQNDIVHCVPILQRVLTYGGYVLEGSSGLATDRGFLTKGGYVRQ